VSINRLTNKIVTIDQAKQAFQQGFQKGLGIKLEPYELSEEQLYIIKKIEEEKYLCDDWNFRK